jgi:hypothetical protein
MIKVDIDKIMEGVAIFKNVRLRNLDDALSKE